jgi:hypothetical protein
MAGPEANEFFMRNRGLLALWRSARSSAGTDHINRVAGSLEPAAAIPTIARVRHERECDPGAYAIARTCYKAGDAPDHRLH